MSLLHFCGERKQKERHLASTLCGPGVQTRAVIYALASTNTLANATVPVTWELILVLTNCQNASNADTCFEVFKKKSADERARTCWSACKRLPHRQDDFFWSSFIL